ncbi:hypothetical protein ABGT15_13015 [Flavobacterium enshiense]|uniref:hypothetical protein n=1 Tax=Flavobacterium enshiense TaxID=1341165 RepID=UPI00345D8FDE
MKIKFLTAIFFFFCAQIFAQNNFKKVSYANLDIGVPQNYESDSEFEISSNIFKARWKYLTEKTLKENYQIFFERTEGDTDVKILEKVNFISSGGKLTGKKYYLKHGVKINNNEKFHYEIVAYGIVNNQPLILTMYFKNNPNQNSDFNDLMKKFILFK